jgi:hypothetical protein
LINATSGRPPRPPWRRRRSLKGRGVFDQLPEFRGQEVNRGLLANDIAEHKKPNRGGEVGVFGGDFGNVAAHFVDGEVLAVRNRTQQVPRCGFEAEAGRPSANPDVTGNQRLVAAVSGS